MHRSAGGFASPRAYIAVLDELRDALVAQGLGRVAYGDLLELRWQVETFGFHALSLEVRQHSGVHGRALELLGEAGVVRPNAPARRPARRLTCHPTCWLARRHPACPWARCWARSGPSVSIQATYSEDACHRYVVSFTHGAEDVLDVLRLASVAGGPQTWTWCLCSSRPTPCPTAGLILDRLLSDTGYREHLDRRG